jgi:hypothetical protein
LTSCARGVRESAADQQVEPKNILAPIAPRVNRSR